MLCGETAGEAFSSIYGNVRQMQNVLREFLESCDKNKTKNG